MSRRLVRPLSQSLFNRCSGGEKRSWHHRFRLEDFIADRNSVEKAKLVYVLNRNSEGKLFPSSPLEAHKNNTLVTHLVAVDQGYDNPLYAALEVDYRDSDEDPTGEAFQNTQKVSAPCNQEGNPWAAEREPLYGQARLA